jgi:hypothetical protein
MTFCGCQDLSGNSAGRFEALWFPSRPSEVRVVPGEALVVYCLACDYGTFLTYILSMKPAAKNKQISGKGKTTGDGFSQMGYYSNNGLIRFRTEPVSGAGLGMAGFWVERTTKALNSYYSKTSVFQLK